MKNFTFLLQNAELQKQLDEMRKSLHVDSVTQALRDVKEYASRASDLNVDSLQLKLMHLDEVARRYDHTDKELYATVLNRFLCYKAHPKIGFLVTSLLCTSAEQRVYEKEQKFLKLHGQVEKKEKKESPSQGLEDMRSLEQFSAMMNFWQAFGPYHARFMLQPRVPINFPPRRGFSNVRPRQQLNSAASGCFNCGDPGHFKVDCPKK